MKHTVKLVLERETKGAVKFMEVRPDGQPLQSADDGLINTTYLRKAKLDGVRPSFITVTVEYE